MQQLFQSIGNALGIMVHNPLWMLRFTIPVFMILFSSFIASMYHKRQTLDATPSFERRREEFRLPQDKFNLEVSRILKEDYSDVIYRIESDFEDAKLRVKEYKRLMRLFRRDEGRLNSGFRRLRSKAQVRRKETLDQLLRLHDGFQYHQERRT